MVTLDRVADLVDIDRVAVHNLTLAVYPPEQSADWAGRDVEWSSAEWCVRVQDGGALVSYVGVYLRAAEWDGRAALVGGIGNVKTHPAARGRGFAGLGVRQAIAFFAEVGADFGLLVCEPHLVGYYARLEWRPFGGRHHRPVRAAVVSPDADPTVAPDRGTNDLQAFAHQRRGR
jgi:hypothetical protein